MSIWGKGGWCFLNERGFSWAETILGLAMLFILFGTLLPMMQQLQQSLHLKRERMVAYETMHEAAKELAATGRRFGERTVNGRTYRWEMQERLCVEYDDYRNRRQSQCIE